MSWAVGFLSKTEKKTSAIKSTPFCTDQRPTNTNSSASGLTSKPAQVCASVRKAPR